MMDQIIANTKKVIIVATITLAILFSTTITSSSSSSIFAQTTSNNMQQTATNNNSNNSSTAFAPPSASIGTKIPLTYQGPPPSEVDSQLVGPHQLLRAGTVDRNASTITLPLYQGQIVANASRGIAGKKVWYILTDTDDKGNADQLGLNYSPKLSFAGAVAARTAILEDNNTLTFNGGAVDFRPNNTLVAGSPPNAFPPKTATPGSMGDNDYSPLVRVINAGNHIYNAPIIAFGVDASQISFCNTNPDYSIVHDKVVNICPEKKTVTLKLTQGFSFGRPVIYLSLDASIPLAATLEKATYAPRLSSITTGQDDGAFSGVERLFALANGPTGKDNPQRQGFNSAITDGLSPLNVLGGIPSIGLDYSPLWDVNVGQWTQQAISNNYTSRLIDEFQVLSFVQQGWITGIGGAPFGSSGIVVNCPIVARLL
jgi:hypothetical protein